MATDLPTGGTPTGNTYDKYASTNPLEQRMMRGFFASLDAMLGAACDGDERPARILEVGIGEGIVTSRVQQRFPSASVVGLDLPDEELAVQWRDLGLVAMFGDATTLPFADATFDLVLAIEVFEHFSRPEAALDELARVCGGTLVASVPFEPVWRLGNMARGRYLGAAGNTPGHVNHWSRWSFRRFVGQRFEVLDVASPLPWTMVHARPR
jgi:ubiquinone/menaquinone biosynthesis C-methylase UbiE